MSNFKITSQVANLIGITSRFIACMLSWLRIFEASMYSSITFYQRRAYFQGKYSSPAPMNLTLTSYPSQRDS